ncbi:MAG: TonB-dependent receptor [Cyanobacteria bacterium]|nr:TonB-dependent receptor [Cyanobacteriota bacterium]
MPIVRTGVAVACAVVLAAAGASAETVRIGIPERGNLQYISFWVAQGAGLFAGEGLDIEVVVPDAANMSGMILMQRRVDVSLLQPPVYLGLIAEQHPFVLFASLLANDPINLIVRGDVAAKLKLDPRAPLADRLKAIKGLKIGVAPEPPRRLRILFAEAGMNADQDVQIVIRRAEDQIEALTSGSVDALYTHSPFLEDALVRLGAMMLVNQSGGEVAALRGGQIHTLGATREYAAANPDVIRKLTRAIAKAQQLIRDSPKAAADALTRAGIAEPSARHLETIVELYRAAVPITPRVLAELIERNSRLYPARPTMPDFTKVRAADYVLDQMERFDLGVVEVSVGAPPSELAPMTHSIDGTAIRNRQALTVKDALEFLPGVALDHKSPRNQTGIALGGFDSRQVPLYFDGIPAYLPFDGYVDLARYLTSDVVEVQVAKGYASPLLGPNLLGGVVNVVTRQPQSALEGDLLLGTASGRQLNAGLMVAGKWRSLSATAHADRLQSDFFSVASSFTPTDIQRDSRRVNSAQRDQRYRVRMAWAPRASDLYVVSSSNQQGVNGIPPYAGQFRPCSAGNATASGVPCVTPRFWKWPQWDTTSYYFNSHTALGGVGALRLRAFYSRFSNRQQMFDDVTFTSMNLAASSGILDNDDRSSGLSGALEARRFGRHAIAASFFVKQDIHAEQTTTFSRANDAMVTPRQTDRDRQSSFGLQDAIGVTSQLRATLGVSADRLDPLGADDLTSDRTATTPFAIGPPIWAINPVGTLTFTPGSAGTFFVTGAGKSRFPTIKDRYSYRAGRALPNPFLRPERARTWTAGYSRTIASRTIAQIDWYRSHVTDEIENIFFLSPLCSGGGRGGAGTCQQAVNVGAEIQYGGSVSIRSSVVPRLTVDANYSYLHRNITGLVGAIAQGTPKHKGVASGTIALPRRVIAIVTLRHQSGIIAISDNGVPLPGARLTTVDAGASAPIRKGLRIQAGVKNLFDADYYYWEGFPEPGRNAHLTMRYSF